MYKSLKCDVFWLTNDVMGSYKFIKRLNEYLAITIIVSYLLFTLFYLMLRCLISNIEVDAIVLHIGNRDSHWRGYHLTN